MSLVVNLPKKFKLAYYVLLVILSLIGVIAIVVRLIVGIKVTALTSPIPWGMWVAIYIYFVGLSAAS